MKKPKIFALPHITVSVLQFSFKCHENEKLPQQFLQGTQRHSVLCSHIAQYTQETERFFLGHFEAWYSVMLFSWFWSIVKQKNVIHLVTDNLTFTKLSFVSHNWQTIFNKTKITVSKTNNQMYLRWIQFKLKCQQEVFNFLHRPIHMYNQWTPLTNLLMRFSWRGPETKNHLCQTRETNGREQRQCSLLTQLRFF